MSPNPILFRRTLLSAAAILGAGALAWSANILKAGGSVSVKVDEKPVATANAGPMNNSYAPIVKRVAPAVVKVLVTERAKNVPLDDSMAPFFDNPGFREFFGDQFGHRGMVRQPPQEGLGSGVIVSDDGYILTNSHVVHGADTIKVTLGDGRDLTAKVVGSDPQSDLAVIKVDAKNLPAITFANSDRLEVGDVVLAIGNPFGIGQTVTTGIVSGLGRATLGLDYEDFIQTDAAINPGNSGGALVDTEGRLVGINTAILSRSGGFQGIGFAIPANLARNVMEQLVSKGKVVRGYIGVTMQDVNSELADEFKLTNRAGALVADVVPNSPAAKAGLKSGDVVTKLDGRPVADSRHLKLAVGTILPGKKISLELLRDGKPITVDLTVATRPSDRALARSGGGEEGSGNDENAAPGENDTGSLNGVGVSDLDSQARQEFDVPARVRGALVISVEPDSASAAAGLQPGDVIQEINRHPVKNADEAVKLTEKSTATKKTLLKVWSQRGTRYVVVDESQQPNP